MLTELYKRLELPMAEMFGRPFPRYFVHPAAEYTALSAAAGVLDLTHWRTLRLTGKDRQTFLNAMVTNEVASLEADRGCHALLTTVKGKIVSELRVFARENDLLAFVTQGDTNETIEVLNKHIITEDVAVEDVSNDFGVVALAGPKAYDILWRIFPTGPFPKEDGTGVVRQFEDTELYVMRDAYMGADRYELMVPAAEIERIRNYVVQASRGSDGLPIGSLAWDMKRIESGVPLYGADFSDDNFPHESRLEDTISYSKGCFRGQETIARLKYRGHVNRMLVGLSPEHTPDDDRWHQLAEAFKSAANNYDEVGLRRLAEPMAAALDLQGVIPVDGALFPADSKDKAVGHVTSAAYSPKLARPLALGYVRYEIADPGNEVQMPDPELSLRVIDLPVEETSNDDPKATP